MFAKNLLSKTLVQSQLARFSTTTQLEASISSGSNWSNVLKSVTRDQVLASTDSKWMGAFVKAVAMAHASGHDTSAHADAVNEYFRKNFRKLSR